MQAVRGSCGRPDSFEDATRIGRGASDSQQAQWDNELHPLPLPVGEVAERSEDGEGKPVGSALSVTFGDSSPKGRAKRLYPHLAREVERICIDTLHNALWLPTRRAAFFVYSRYFFSFSRFSLLMGVSGRRHPPQS